MRAAIAGLERELGASEEVCVSKIGGSDVIPPASLVEIEDLGEGQFKFVCRRSEHDDLIHHGSQDSVAMSVQNVEGRPAFRVKF